MLIQRMHLLKSLQIALITFGISSLGASIPTYSDISLPVIGDTSSSIVSMQKEQEIGAIFLKMLHSQLPTETDPELVQYIENLVYRLAEASQLQNRRLSIILIDSPYLNAFAAPGGVVGINTGLFLHAKTEEEFASVIAHELAHLSQRHYARGVEAAQRQTLPTMAALLGSIVLAAAGAGDLGVAALSSTIAGAQSSQLTFSRTNEQEADRIGILTMVRASMNPRGMADLFERMSKMEGTGPQYEFLRTHPLSRSRVADARSRAEQYPSYPSRNTREYEQMRNRAVVKMTQSLDVVRNRFRQELSSGRTPSEQATRYALALIELEMQNPKQAGKVLAPALTKSQGNDLPVQILNNQILFAKGDKKGGIAGMRKLLAGNPGNYPVIMTLADLLHNDGQYKEAMTILKAESRKRPQDPYIWYLLAETAGLAGDITGVHTSRAEYFFLVGNMDDCIQQLEYAMEQPKLLFSQKAALKTRIDEVNAYKKNMKL